jgi:hypothetical protein
VRADVYHVMGMQLGVAIGIAATICAREAPSLV